MFFNKEFDMYTDKDLIITLQCIGSEKSEFLLSRLGERQRIMEYIQRYQNSNPKFIAYLHHGCRQLIEEFAHDTSGAFTMFTKQLYTRILSDVVNKFEDEHFIRVCGSEIRNAYTLFYHMYHAWKKAKTRARSIANYRNFVEKYNNKARARGYTEHWQLFDLDLNYARHMHKNATDGYSIKSEWLDYYSLTTSRIFYCKFARGFCADISEQEAIAAAMARIEIYERIFFEKGAPYKAYPLNTKFPGIGTNFHKDQVSYRKV